MAEAVALEITENKLRYARFRVKSGQFICPELKLRTIDGGWLEGLEAAVSAVIDECGCDVRYAVSLPVERAHLRELQFPFSEKRQVAQAVPFSVEEFLPGASEDYTNAHLITGVEATGAKVWALSCQSALLQGIFNAFAKHKIFPEWVTTDIVAAAHIIPAGTPLIVADCSGLRAHLSVYNGEHFAGGRSFLFNSKTFLADCNRSLAALNALGRPVGFTAAAARQLGEAGIAQFAQAKLLQLPQTGGGKEQNRTEPQNAQEQPELTAALWGLARAVLEERECELSLCAGAFAQPAVWQRMAVPILFFAFMLCVAAGLAFGHFYHQNQKLQRGVNELVAKRETFFRQILPKAVLPRYADEQEGMIRNYIRKYVDTQAGTAVDRPSALLTWLRYYAMLPRNPAAANWWMLQLDAREDEMAMTVRADSFQIGMALLDASLKSGEYESKLDDLHKDDKSVTFVLRSKLIKQSKPVQ